MTTREEILEAALRLYTQSGSRGATTRRIAEGAGITEVTLFRHFRSKRELLREALERAASRVRITPLPADPIDPCAELELWCRAELEGLYRVRSLLRTSMGEFEESPEVGRSVCAVQQRVSAELRAYLARLCEVGRVPVGADTAGVARMLMGSLFAEAVSRDIMPEGYPDTLAEAASRYARLALAALGGAQDAAAHGLGEEMQPARAEGRHGRRRSS